MLKIYPKIKKSNIPWVGDIPNDWNVQRCKWLFNCKKELNNNYVNNNVLSLTLRGVVNNDPENPEGLVPKDYGTYQFFKKNDLVFKLIDLENLRTSRVGLVHEDGIMSPAYIRLEARHGGIQKFFYYQFYDLYQRGVFNKLGAGVRSTLGPSDLLNLYILVPKIDEQVLIVDYLDYINSYIDSVIRAKQKYIRLLNEQKLTVVYRTVTSGIDPKVEFKTTNIPWIQIIPKHWEVKRIKQASRINRGKFSYRPRNDPSLYDGKYPFIQTGAIARAGKYITTYSQTLNEKGFAVSKFIPSGTLLMSIAANIGDVAILGFDSCIPDSIVGFTPFSEIERDYLYYVFLCMKKEFLSEAPVNTQGNLNIERIGTMKIPIPPQQEQQQIVDFIEDGTKNFDAIIKRTKDEINLINEYRTRIISDIVTGKLDVSEAARHLSRKPSQPKVVVEEEQNLEEENEPVTINESI